jgi:hypothetical protein
MLNLLPGGDHDNWNVDLVNYLLLCYRTLFCYSGGYYIFWNQGFAGFAKPFDKKRFVGIIKATLERAAWL